MVLARRYQTTRRVNSYARPVECGEGSMRWKSEAQGPAFPVLSRRPSCRAPAVRLMHRAV